MHIHRGELKLLYRTGLQSVIMPTYGRSWLLRYNRFLQFLSTKIGVRGKIGTNGSGIEPTFSCQPRRTLPLTSPHPGIPMPLYKYFIRVSCASGGSDLTTFGMSVDFVLFRTVTTACSVRFWGSVRGGKSRVSLIVTLASSALGP